MQGSIDPIDMKIYTVLMISFGGLASLLSVGAVYKYYLYYQNNISVAGQLAWAIDNIEKIQAGVSVTKQSFPLVMICLAVACFGFWIIFYVIHLRFEESRSKS